MGGGTGVDECEIDTSEVATGAILIRRLAQVLQRNEVASGIYKI